MLKAMQFLSPSHLISLYRTITTYKQHVLEVPRHAVHIFTQTVKVNGIA